MVSCASGTRARRLKATRRGQAKNRPSASTDALLGEEQVLNKGGPAASTAFSVGRAASTAAAPGGDQTATQVSTLVRLRPSEHSGRAQTKQTAPSCVSPSLRWILVCG